MFGADYIRMNMCLQGCQHDTQKGRVERLLDHIALHNTGINLSLINDLADSMCNRCKSRQQIASYICRQKWEEVLADTDIRVH